MTTNKTEAGAMSKHTPGPWMVEGCTVYALNDDGYNRFSALVQDAHTPVDELEANARLIAAAPELLSLLKEARSTLEMWKDVAPAVSLCADIDKAIAKARGEK